MHAGSWESTREEFEWHEAKPSASLASQVLSQLPKCIQFHNSINAQLKAWTIHFDWLNAIMQIDRHTGMCLSRFRWTLVPYKKHTKNCQLFSNVF